MEETIEALHSDLIQDINALIVACEFKEEAYVLVEELPQYVIENKERQRLLRFARLGEIADLAGFTSGRVFDQQAELRWEKNADGRYRVVYLGAKHEIRGLKKDEKDQQELDSLERARELRYYYLFGEYLDADKLKNMGIEPEEGYYAEVRIPRLLRYPAPAGARRVQLVVREYLDKDTNEVKLFRFQGLSAAE